MEKGWNIQTMSNFDYIEMVNEIWPSGMVITVISEDKFRFLRKKILKFFVHKNFVTEISCSQK